MADIIKFPNIKKALANPHPMNDLSFMCRMPNGKGMHYWNVEPTGNYPNDCQRGRELAIEYLTYLGAHPTYGNMALLGSIVVAMIESAPEKGLVIGFMGAVNEYAAASARLLAGEFKVPSS